WIFLLYAGRMKETLIEWERAKRLALERQDPVYVSVNNAGVAWISEVLGNCDASVLAHGRAAVESAERVGYSHGVYYGWEASGIGRSIRGEWAESRAALERALDVSREERVGGACEARALAHLARAELFLGDVDRARATIEAAVCAGQEHHTRVFE